MTPRIAIVGAGIAGLTAALTLHDAGLACAVYEASYRVGGRMHSDTTTWPDGMVSEWCGEFIGGDHTTLRQLIARFGLSTAALTWANPGIANSVMYFRGHYYSTDDLGRDFQAIAPLLRQQSQEAGPITTYDQFTRQGARLDQLSVYHWIERHVPGGHGAPLGRVLDNACSGVYGLDTREQSSLNLVYMFSARDVPSTASASQSAPGNSKIVGGNERLPAAIARGLPDGTIHLGHRLVALERAGDETLTLSLDTADGPARVQCEYAILALPFSTLRHVDYERAAFDPLKRTAIERLGYGTVSKLFLRFDEPYWYSSGPWPHRHSGFFVTDLDVQTVWDASTAQSGAQGALLVDYTSGRRGAAFVPPAPYTTSEDSAIIQRYAENCLRELEAVLPGISAHYTDRAALSYPTGDPNLLGSYSCWRVGQYTQFAGYERVRQGRILFAGEHCSVEFQGYMEGAAREGIRAAQEIIQESS